MGAQGAQGWAWPWEGAGHLPWPRSWVTLQDQLLLEVSCPTRPNPTLLVSESVSISVTGMAGAWARGQERHPMCCPPSRLAALLELRHPNRHHGAHRVHRRAGCWLPGQRLRHVGAPEPAVPADPEDDPHGPAWRHLEAPGLRGVRAQQGEPPVGPPIRGRKQPLPPGALGPQRLRGISPEHLPCRAAGGGSGLGSELAPHPWSSAC